MSEKDQITLWKIQIANRKRQIKMWKKEVKDLEKLVGDKE